VVGPLGDAHLHLNPISIVAPGFLRKPFEYQNNVPDHPPGPDAR
jgi:hypothetical protein